MAASWALRAAIRTGSHSGENGGVHPNPREIYTVQEELTVALDGRTQPSRPVSAGESIEIPPGSVHGFSNPSDQAVRFTADHVPALRFEEYIRLVHHTVQGKKAQRTRCNRVVQPRQADTVGRFGFPEGVPMITGAAAGPARRLSSTVSVAVAFGMIALYAALTAAPLVAEDLTGTRALSGLPGAAAIAGTSTGTALLSALMARRGRRPGLAVGWVTGVAGAVLALVAIIAGSFVPFVLAMLVLGVGHGANQLARFAAADPHPLARRGLVLSLVVWVGTIGAVVGPNLLDPIGSVAERLGMAPLAGGYLAAGTAFGLAALIVGVALRPDPARFAVDRLGPARAERGGGWDREILVAVAALVAAQFVMLLVMTMAPVHVRGHEYGLATVGGVMSVHFAAMFGLAPLAGKASDRFGGLPVALAGLVMVATAGLLAAIAPTSSVAVLTVALLLLGLGWSAAFVASSSLLASAGALVQGRADAVGWAFAALASISSGILIATVGFPTMCLVGAAIAAAAALRVGREIRQGATDRPDITPVLP